ncbi:hypothetical protein [Burkholderia phage vB_BpP_HN02]|uniref:Uncharacterized protein n=1 Tax=Burkholderia phage vB_BpP_HN02 TaxID=3116925 RepID=A0AAX4JIF1_9CAUD
MAKFLNECKHGDHTYISVFDADAVIIYARSMPQAHQIAIEHFKPKKRDKKLIETKLHIMSMDLMEHVERFANYEGNA